MPPKKAPATSKKTEIKKKEKVIEDKTFGLKNKKGAKTQKYIAQVEKQVKSGGQHNLLATKPDDKKLEKEKKLKDQKELALLFKPVIVQKIGADTDPKSVLCAFFKQGQCTKGDKCKFSHDLTIERKTEKRSIYVDVRDVETDGETMENWDETKLKEVVDKKHAAEKTNATTIICKYFLEAVEKSLYGWFWSCPNGEKCIYRHALPPGYVLKKDKKKDDKKDEISLEELIESERAALGSNTTKVTLESFLSWKKRKIDEKIQAQLEEEKKKMKDFKSGKQFGISGREMFSFNPDLVHDNSMDDDEQAIDIVREKDENDHEFKEVDFSAYNMGLKEVDGTGTIATDDRFDKMRESVKTANETPSSETNGDEAAGTTIIDEAGPINENLFLNEDLDGLDDELNDLDLN
ncbi:CLUMA_CG013187, isoform A [Clunio marinus]|uniref:Zinc finger CCCH domain-containing protein 15 n=1 Tax=Clunio marinus TaxID=568069 RepID=A0A1J1IK16_9DIPT|nr:CLUMA_CG013187, isoform A [Clunio marinus]